MLLLLANRAKYHTLATWDTTNEDRCIIRVGGDGDIQTTAQTVFAGPNTVLTAPITSTGQNTIDVDLSGVDYPDPNVSPFIIIIKGERIRVVGQ